MRSSGFNEYPRSEIITVAICIAAADNHIVYPDVFAFVTSVDRQYMIKIVVNVLCVTTVGRP